MKYAEINVNSGKHFRLNYKLHETSTLGYHVVNIICHTVATLVFYKLGKQLEHIFDFFNIAFSASILFAVHPVHTEAVRNQAKIFKNKS